MPSGSRAKALKKTTNVWRANLAGVLLAGMLCLLQGCVAHRTGDAVRRISFSVEGRPFPQSLWVAQSDAALRDVMSQRVSSWQSLLFPGAIEPVWLDRTHMKEDGIRIESWFAEHGYFDAHFINWDVWRYGSKKRKMHPVALRGNIVQGEPSRIRSIKVNGLDDIPSPTIRAAMTLVVGHIFLNQEYSQNLAALERALQNLGYAFVAVSGSVDVFPEELAVDIVVTVVPGPLSHFGAVTLVGVEGMPKNVVEDAVPIEAGDVFRPKALLQTRAGLAGMNVFSVVNVIPDLKHPETAEVPVRINVRNGKWRRVKVGPGLQVENVMAAVYGQAEWEHTNLFHRLWHFKQGLKIGVAGLVAQGTTLGSLDPALVTYAPLVDLTSSLSIPHLIGPSWSFNTDARMQVGIEPGYHFFSPEIAAGLIWQPMTASGRGPLSVGFDYRIRYFDYFAFTIDVHDIIDSPLGLDLTDPYLLSMLDQHFVWDGRDDPMAPNRGWYLSAALAEAGGPLFGNFNFVRAQGEVRHYQSLPLLAGWNPHLVIATRIGSGVVAPYGDGPKASVPYAERLYLGGGTTVRGWGANRLGPAVETTNRVTGLSENVPAGGLFEMFGNLELRKGIAGGVSVAAFTDVGRVWPSITDFSLSGLQWTVGGGLRYATAIGPIRADVGVRVSPDAPELGVQPPWTLHFGLSEAF